MFMQGMFQSRHVNSYKILHKYKTTKYVKNNYFSKKCNFKVVKSILDVFLS